MIRIGAVLGGYQIEAAIGQGGMATVYRARRVADGQTAALKILREQFAADAEFVERFQREARAVASLTHPNMVQVFESGEADGVHFIAMEFVEGQDLKRRVRDLGGPLEIAEAVRIGAQVCEVLDYAHRRGIIHRDIKPQNILLTREGGVKVTDFGIARALSAVTITQTGTVLGSVQYLSPEAARGEATGRAADIYALAVVLFEMVTGELPFDGDSPIAVALKHLHEVPPAPSELNPEVPLALEAVILRGMAKSPRHRYPTAGDLATDLLGQTSFWKEGMLEAPGAEPTRIIRPGVRPRSTPSRAALQAQRVAALWRRLRLSRALAPVLAVLAVALLTGGVWGAWRSVAGYYTVAEVQVPALVGLPLREAEARAKEAGVGLNAEARGYSETIPAGSVISQDQPKGKRVKAGRVIGVVVSRGKEQVVVPDVVGQPLPNARLVIENARLRVGRVDERFDDSVRTGLIMTQDPPAGGEAPRNTAVTLLVSRGPELVEMPVLVGRSLAEARARLEELGLIVRQVRSAVSADVPPGTVVDQSPDPGKRIKPAQTEVTLTVSVRPGAEQRPPQLPVVTGERQTTVPPPTAPASSPSPRGERARGELRTAVRVVVPDGPGGQRVRIIVIDERGVRTVYEKAHRPGERIDMVVESRGYTIIQVYINSTLVQEIRP